jgi:2-keto-3-deoxy-6-phosphogluconate aldolase
MGPGPFTPLGQLLSTLNKGGMVLLGDMQLNQPTAGKRVFVLSKNADTIAVGARSGGQFFLSPGADPTLVLAAQKRVKALYAPSLFASMGPFGMAALVAGVGAAAYFGFIKKGKKKK